MLEACATVPFRATKKEADPATADNSKANSTLRFTFGVIGRSVPHNCRLVEQITAILAPCLGSRITEA